MYLFRTVKYESSFHSYLKIFDYGDGNNFLSVIYILDWTFEHVEREMTSRHIRSQIVIINYNFFWETVRNKQKKHKFSLETYQTARKTKCSKITLTQLCSYTYTVKWLENSVERLLHTNQL